MHNQCLLRSAIERRRAAGRSLKYGAILAILSHRFTEEPMMRVPVLALCALFLLPYGNAHAVDSPELRRLFEQDQAARSGTSDHLDSERRHQVFAALASLEQPSARDRFHAAMVLQHTDLRFLGGRLVSVSSENYLFAHLLAKQAYADGVKEAGILAAQALDRYLTFTEGRQRYGTNRLFDSETEQEFLVEVDGQANDEERRALGLPPLSELRGDLPMRRHLLPD